jgi:hypothetical protein
VTPEACAADGGHRELAGIPDEVMFATVGGGLTTTAAGAAKLIPDRGRQRLRTGSGTKGVRHYDWAMLQITADNTPGEQDDGHSMLLIRRHRYTRTLSFYPVLDPAAGPAVAADRRRAGPLADRRGPPARKAGRRPGLRPGHPLEVLALQPARPRP